jgi:hypothetical protein
MIRKPPETPQQKAQRVQGAELQRLRARNAQLTVQEERYRKLLRVRPSVTQKPPAVAAPFQLADPRRTSQVGSKVLAPLTPPLGLARVLSATITQALRDMALEARTLIRSLQAAPGAEEQLQAAMDALPEDAQHRLDALRRKWQQQFDSLAARWAHHMITGVVAQSDAQLSLGLKDFLARNTIVSTMQTPRMRAVVEAATQSSVGLITRIPERFLGGVQTAVMNAITTGSGLNQLVPYLTKKYKGDARHAHLVALDQVRKVSESVNSARLQSLGVEEYVWIATGGERYPRKLHHEKLNGQTFRYDDPPVIDERTGERGKPGDAINCLPGSSQIEMAHGINKLFRRRFTGHLTKLITENGSVLEATPNHPVLTGGGWKAIQLVDVGEYVVKTRTQRADCAETNIQRCAPTFQELFELASLLVDVDRRKNRSVELEFHGDASDGEVDVIDIDRFLPQEFDPEFCEQLLKFALAFPDTHFRRAIELNAGARYEFFVRTLGAPNGVVRGLCALLALFAGHAGHANNIGGALAAWFHACFSQTKTDSVSADAVSRSKFQHTGTQEILGDNLSVGQLLAISSRAFDLRNDVSITADELAEVTWIDSNNFSSLFKVVTGVEKRERVTQRLVSEFSDHVYNLETRRNWYAGNGLIIHNCRCRARPVVNFMKMREVA